MKKLTTEDFIKKAQELHGVGTYDYSKVVYAGARSKVTITCPLHGTFEQVATYHINNGCGCPKCGIEAIKQSSKSREVEPKGTTEGFIKQAVEKHGGKYTYDKVEYTGVDNKVTITCPKHGDFQQVAYSHLKGHGCRKCSFTVISAKASERSVESNNYWSYSDWKTAGEESKNFEGFSLYVIECSSKTTGEHFIKVGKTFVGTAQRFRSDTAMPYKYKVLTQVYHNAYAISKLEEQIKKEFRKSKYLPQKEFAGMHECLDVETKERVVEMAEA